MKLRNKTFSFKKSRLFSFVCYHKVILIVMVLLFATRLLTMYELGIEYSLKNDDLAYINSAFNFIETGTISMHNQYPSAQIMPGMTVFIGLLSLIFGKGKLLWLVIKLLWFTMNALTAWYIYRCVTLFAPRWCGVAAVIPLFRSDYIWMDNLPLTETPFLLCLVAMVYYTLKMGKENKGYANFWCCLIAYMAGLMLKANIAPYPVFALIYLLIVKYDKKLLFKQCAILASVVLCFVIPWSIRNYIHFDAFIPLTYGSGNPTLLGTYQGRGYPLDSELDYTTNVNDVVREKYADYYGEDGQLKPEYKRYVGLQADGIKASYRQKVWAEKDIKGMLHSYLIYKPQKMIFSIFYWKTVNNINADILIHLPYIEMLLCGLAIFAALVLKKLRGPVIYAFLVYIGNIYIYAATFSFSRYNVSLVYLRYIVIGIGPSLVLQLIKKGYDAIIKEESASDTVKAQISDELKDEKEA